MYVSELTFHNVQSLYISLYYRNNTLTALYFTHLMTYLFIDSINDRKKNILKTITYVTNTHLVTNHLCIASGSIFSKLLLVLTHLVTNFLCVASRPIWVFWWYCWYACPYDLVWPRLNIMLTSSSVFTNIPRLLLSPGCGCNCYTRTRCNLNAK